MLTRSGLDWTARFRPIAAALAALPVKTAYLDGESPIRTSPRSRANTGAAQDGPTFGS